MPRVKKGVFGLWFNLNKLQIEVNKDENNIEVSKIRTRNKEVWPDMPLFEEGQRVNPFGERIRKLQCERCGVKNYSNFYYIEGKITCQGCLNNE